MKAEKKPMFGVPKLAMFFMAAVALFAFAGAVFAVAAQPAPIVDYQVSLIPGINANGGQSVGVSVFQLSTNGDSRDALAAQNQHIQMITDLQTNKDKAIGDAQARLALAAKNGKTTVSTVQNAKVKMFYMKSGSAVSLTCVGGTNELTLDNSITGDNGIALYNKECAIPKEVYEGTCTRVSAQYIAPNGVIKTGGADICDRSLAASDEFSNGLTQFFGDQANQPMFLVMFTLFGLLLASMYFSGKSPISMLDITTPKLPSPKALTAGGQMLGAFGYSELKGVTAKHLGALGGVFGAEIAARKVRAGMAGEQAVERAVNSMKPGFGEKAALGDVDRQKVFARSAGYGALEVGGVDRVNRIQGILNKHIYNWGEGEHREFAKLLSDLEKSGGRNTMFSGTLRDHYMTMLQQKKLETLTGQAGAAGGRAPIIQTVQTVVGMVGGPGRVGELTRSTVDSGFRALKMAGTAVAGGAGMIGLAVGGRKFEGALQQLKSKKGGEWLESKLLSAAGIRVKVGEVDHRRAMMAAAYKEIDEEAHRSASMHAMAQIFKKHGIQFNLSEEELATMGHTSVDIAARCRMSPTAMHEIVAAEAEIRAVLSKTTLDVRQKAEALLELAKSHGATIDQAVHAEMAYLGTLRDSRDHDHVKMISISTHIDEFHNAAGRNAHMHNDNEFCYAVGRELGEHNAFQTLVLRKYINDAENAMSFTLLDQARAVQMHRINRITTCDPLSGPDARNLPEYMLQNGDAPFIANKARIRDTIVDMLTEEGRLEFRTKHGKDASKATFEEAFGMLTRDGKGYMTEGLNAPTTWFKIGMGGHWVAGIDDAKQYNLATHVNNFFRRSYQSPYNAAVERECLETHPDFHSLPNERQMSIMKQVWVKQYVMEDVNQLMKSVYASNGYGVHNQSMPSMQQMQGILREAVRIRGGAGSEHLAEEIDSLRLSVPSDVRRFKQLLQTHNDAVEAFEKRGVMYNDVSKGKTAWVLLGEGGMVPYVHGMLVHDNDRILGGYLAYKDERGRWQRFQPNNIDIRFEGRPDLQAAFNMLNREHDSHRPVLLPNGKQHDWRSFVKEVDAWAEGKGLEAAKMVAAVKFRYGNSTGEWAEVSSFVSVVPKRDVAPTLPDRLKNIPDPLQGAAQKMRNALLGIGDVVSKFSLGMGGLGERGGDGSGMIAASYGITPFASAARLQMHGMQKQLINADWEQMLRGLTKAQADAIIKKYESVGKTYGMYYQVAQYTLDRAPGAFSSSYGTQQSISAYFNRGPGNPYSLKQNIGTWMPKGEQLSFMLQGGMFIGMAQAVFKPFSAAFRNAQHAMQNLSSRHDEFGGNALRISGGAGGPRFREALYGFNPANTLSAVRMPDWNFLPSWMRGRAINPFGESSSQRAMTSGSRFMGGLAASATDSTKRLREGIGAQAREGGAGSGSEFDVNPGETDADMWRRVRADPRMASFLAFHSGEASMAFFQSDAATMKDATRATYKRTVAAEWKLAHAESELSSFGIMQNMQLNKFMSPAFFGYKYLVQPILGTSQNWKVKGGGWGGFVDSYKERKASAKAALARTLTPWDEGKRRSCSCGTPGIAGGKCARCGKQIYGSA